MVEEKSCALIFLVSNMNHFETSASSILTLFLVVANLPFAASFLFCRIFLSPKHDSIFSHLNGIDRNLLFLWNSIWDFMGLFAFLSLLFHFNCWLSSRWRNGRGAFLSPLPRLQAEEWQQEVALVTGGSGGLGIELAMQLARKGSKVMLWDVVPPRQRLADNVKWAHCDVSSFSEVTKSSQMLIEEYGVPTILINNAGVSNGKLLVDLSEADVLRMTGVNLNAHFWTLKAFLPAMLQARKGHIISIASIMGHLGVAQMTDYVATKHALVGLHEALRYELDNKYKTPNIRTSLYSLGHLRTPLFSNVTFSAFARLLLPSLDPPQVAQRIISGIERRKSEEVGMPLAVNFAWLGRGLPSWARDLIQWASGADHSMAQAT